MKKLDQDDKYYISEKLLEKVERFEKYRYKGGRPENKYIVITNTWLSNYFNVPIRTIKYWIKIKKLDPNNIDLIVRLKDQLNNNK